MAYSGGDHHLIIPDAVMGATSEIAAHLDELKRHLHSYLDLAEPMPSPCCPRSTAPASSLYSPAPHSLSSPVGPAAASPAETAFGFFFPDWCCVVWFSDGFVWAVRLRCTGVRPEEHAVNAELERLKLYEEKLEHFNDLNKAPLKPSTTLNRQAAACFIGHSLPDLTPEQKRSMRGIVHGGNRDCLD